MAWPSLAALRLRIINPTTTKAAKASSAIIKNCPKASPKPSEWASQAKPNPNAAYAGSVPYLMLAGNLVSGWQMARALLAAQALLAKGEDVAFLQAKIATAQFYAEHILVKTGALRDSIVGGAGSVMALPLEAF